ncbi:ankyrin repeat and SOCS box protein 11 [Clinocottus analis]|uniref:ankyrin repeat and SOCS box protein 11 n=1 Tax=Clinocottus analis TaxID=304258 RepID=UPI0035BF1AFB
MAAVQTEAALLSAPWQRCVFVYGGLACNSLMADFWSDRSPLHEAAHHGRLLQMRSLIAQGFHVDALSMDRVSPLHEACLGGRAACAKFLLENGADVETVSTDGATALFNSCSSGSAACVRLVLQHGASIQPRLLASPMHEAAKRGHAECLQLLLSSGAPIDMELPLAGTPLYSACTARAAACVSLLLLSGADVHGGCGPDSPLHAAVRGGAVSVVDLLLDFGADGCRRNAEGKTPLALASASSAVRAALQTKGPGALSQLCRVRVRQSLGSRRLHRAAGLVLPLSLKDFLLYETSPSGR